MSLSINLQNLATRVASETKALRTLVNGNTADLSSLTTTTKTSLVAAVNELQSAIDAIASAEGGATIDDEATAGTTVWSSAKVAAQISAAVATLVDTAPGALDTLNELAAALGDDPSFATTINTALTNRVRTDTATQGLDATSQTNARTNIGAASATHGHALTDAGITGVLPVAKGGTGGGDAATARTNLGAAPTTHTHSGADITSGTVPGARLPVASDTVQGIVELSTNAEVATGTDTARAVTPAGLRYVTGDPETNLVSTFEAGLV